MHYMELPKGSCKDLLGVKIANSAYLETMDLKSQKLNRY